MADDLARVDRAATPWVVAAMHRMMAAPATWRTPLVGDVENMERLQADYEELFVGHGVSEAVHTVLGPVKWAGRDVSIPSYPTHGYAWVCIRPFPAGHSGLHLGWVGGWVGRRHTERLPADYEELFVGHGVSDAYIQLYTLYLVHFTWV